MAVNFCVVLQKNENLGYGFSLLGKEGFPHIIYNVEKDSPASENQVSVETRQKLAKNWTGAKNRNFYVGKVAEQQHRQ